MSIQKEERSENVHSDFLSLLDFDRVIALLKEVAREWKDKALFHLRIGEDSLKTDDVDNITDLVGRLGGFRELDYIAAFAGDQLMLTADFSNGQIRFRSVETQVLNKFVNYWSRVRKKIRYRKDLVELATSIDGKRFILSCLDDQGGLSDIPKKPAKLDHSYAISRLESLGMKHILLRFASFLTNTQNEDGGWGVQPDSPSRVIPTAGAIMVLAPVSPEEIKNRDACLSKAAGFLVSKRKQDGTWEDDKRNIKLTTIISTIALLRIQRIEPSERRVPLFFQKCVSEIQVQKFDSVLARNLKEMDLLSKDDILQILKNVAFDIENEYAFLSWSSSIVTVTLLANLLLWVGVSPNDSRIRSIYGFLVRSRNIDGGWPLRIGEKSMLYPTILCLDALKAISFQEQSGDVRNRHQQS